ncbi:MAG: NfeD family protein [Cyanobacteria bacterium P01_D01_bin.56]
MLDETGIGIVDEAIDPILGGRVRFQGSIWPAFSKQGCEFQEDDIVRVLGRNGIALEVEKYS